MSSATACAHPNIAFIKYWGNQDHRLRIPSNGSISMNLAELETRTTVTFDDLLEGDTLVLDGKVQKGPPLKRISIVLDWVRQLSGEVRYAQVESWNNFPAGTGIASSASAFAALTLSACCAAGLEIEEAQLSRIARLGSGSACRSVPGGFVEWHPGEDHNSSYAVSIASKEHWSLVDCITIITTKHKTIGSAQGHKLAESSPLQAARLLNSKQRLDLCRTTILKRDFKKFAEISEFDTNLMHAVTMTTKPPVIYWLPETVRVIRKVKSMQYNSIPVCYSIDAGANVHVICPEEAAEEVSAALISISGVKDVIIAHPGGPAYPLT